MWSTVNGLFNDSINYFFQLFIKSRVVNTCTYNKHDTTRQGRKTRRLDATKHTHNKHNNKNKHTARQAQQQDTHSKTRTPPRIQPVTTFPLPGFPSWDWPSTGRFPRADRLPRAWSSRNGLADAPLARGARATKDSCSFPSGKDEEGGGCRGGATRAAAWREG